VPLMVKGYFVITLCVHNTAVANFIFHIVLFSTVILIDCFLDGYCMRDILYPAVPTSASGGDGQALPLARYVTFD
ncbi:MAG: hypothetical protein RR846_10290, partial [Oscillospiraceae bacterium]